MAAERLFMLLILSPSVIFVVSVKINGKFIRYKDLDGYRCAGGKTLFQMEKKNLIECVKQCGSGCHGVLYEKDAQLCLGCSSLCDMNNQTDVISGTSCYRRDFCPTCESVWVPLPQGSSKIQVRTQPATQPDAAAICECLGGNLVKIDRIWKMDFIVDVLKTDKGSILYFQSPIKVVVLPLPLQKQSPMSTSMPDLFRNLEQKLAVIKQGKVK